MTLRASARLQSRRRPQSFYASRFCRANLNLGARLFGGGLETFFAGAPVFWPGRSFLELVAGLCFPPFRAAFFLPLARGEWPALGSFIYFSVLLARSPAAARWQSDDDCDIGAAIVRRRATAANMTLYMSTSFPWFRKARGAVGRRSAASPATLAVTSNAHRFYASRPANA